MVKKSTDNKKKALLKKEYHMPLPDNKVGAFLGRKATIPGIIKNSKIFTYVRESRQEVKKVTWPSRKESLKLTLAVIVFTAVFSLFTTVIDYGFEKAVQQFI